LIKAANLIAAPYNWVLTNHDSLGLLTIILRVDLIFYVVFKEQSRICSRDTSGLKLVGPLENLLFAMRSIKMVKSRKVQIHVLQNFEPKTYLIP